MSEDVRIKTIGAITGLDKKKETTISDVKQQAENMSVIDETIGNARKLSGADALEQKADSERRERQKVEQERDKAVEDKHQAQLNTLRVELGSKVDELARSLAGGASQKNIGDQISEIKKAASELNLGGSKISEVREMLSLIDSLNPKKTLVEQIKDAKELITIISPPAEKPPDFTIGGMPSSVALELKKMDQHLQITLENMKDDRQRKDQEFQFNIKKYDSEVEMRRQEIAGKLAVEREKSQMIANAIEMIGRAGGKAVLDGIRGAPQETGRVSGRITGIELPEGAGAEFPCPNCNSPMAVGPTSTLANCVGCKSQFPITRISTGPSSIEVSQEA